MGLIRKSLMLGTAGVVKGSSKKQRNSKSQLKEQREQTRLAQLSYNLERERAIANGEIPPDEEKPTGFWQNFINAFLGK